MAKEKIEDSLAEKLQQLNSKIKESAKTKAKADTVDILSYDANTLWNEYMENPALLDHNKWEFLASKLDTLVIDESSKTNFCIFRAEFDKGPEEKIIVTPQTTPVWDFKEMLRHIMISDLSMKDIGENIITIKTKLDMNEIDFKECLDIVKLWIRDMHYVWRAEEFQSLVHLLERELALKLRGLYVHGEKVLTASDRYFLADYIYDHDDNLKIGETILKNFLSQSEWKELPTQEITAEEKQTILQSRVERLFDKAGETLQKFLKLAATPGYKMPEEGYNPSKTAGFVTISFGDKDRKIPREKVQKRQIGEGAILTEEDKDYGTRGQKYSFFSMRKDISCILEGKKDSGETSFNKTGVKGDIQFDFDDKGMGIGYSWGTELQDQAIVVIAAHEANIISNQEFTYKQETLNNPYLTAEFLNDLKKVM